MPETTVLKVLLHCDGCVSKVKRHIRRLEGVESFHIDQKNSKVTVYGTVKPQVVLDKVLRAGKTAEFWPQPVVAKEDASAQVAKEVVGGKKKATDAGGNVPKKQKNGKKAENEESEEEEFGDGEIVDATDIPALEVEDESDERVLIMDKKPASKKSGNRKG